MEELTKSVILNRERTDAMAPGLSDQVPAIAPAFPCMLEITGKQHVITFANGSFCRLSGFSPEELVGKPFAAIANDGASTVQMLDRIYETGAFEPRLESDGKESKATCWLEIPWPDGGIDKKPIRIIIQMSKVSLPPPAIGRSNDAPPADAAQQSRGSNEEQRTDAPVVAELRQPNDATDSPGESEARLTAVLEHLPVGVSLIDTNGRTVLLNTLMHRFIPGRLPSADPKRIHRWHAWNPDGSPLESNFWPGARAMRGETVIPGIEFLFTEDDGRNTWTNIATAPLRNTSGAITGAVVMVQDIDQHKRADEALQQSKRSVSRILESITDSFYVVGADWRLSDMNAAARRIFVERGLDPQTLLGKDFWEDAFPDTVGTALEPEYRRAMQERVASEFDYFYPGWQRWFRVRIYPIEEGGITIYFHEITGEKVASEKLRASEERFRALVTATSNVVYRMTADWSEMLRLDGRNFLADTDKPTPAWLQSYIHPEDQTLVLATINEAIRNKSMFALEHRVKQADGLWGWTSSRAIPILDTNGEIIEWFGAATDITARIRGDDARNASAEHFHFLAESMQQKIFTASASGEMDYFNGQWMKFTNLPLGQILASGWFQFIPPDEVEEMQRRWNHSVASGEDFEWEHRIRRHDGVFRWHVTRAHAMRDKATNVRLWIGSSTDIDEVRRTMEEVSRGIRAKDDFLAALSHELRTPLTPVLMTISALCDDPRIPRDIRVQLTMSERNLTLEARLIDDLLDLTKISHGKLLLRSLPFDAHNLIRFAGEIVQEEARAKGVAIEFDLEAQHSGLVADPTRFQQVVWNLLRNALKFTPAGGRICIMTRNDETVSGQTGLRIEVVDTGIGIERERLEQIFLPFDQGGLVGDHRFGGLGLGLAIARAVVDLHGGRISAQSAGKNQGATFVVELPDAINLQSSNSRPASPTTVEPWAPARSGQKTTKINPLRLLVVEDHQSTLETLRRLLLNDGHSVVTASTVASALAEAESNKFDLVISDLGLPDATGIELMKKLAARHQLKGIALSGYGMEEDIAHSAEAGFTAHLVKPISLADLRNAILSFSSQQ